MRASHHKAHGRLLILDETHKFGLKFEFTKEGVAISSPYMPLQEVNTNGLLVGVSEVALAIGHA